MTLSLHLTRKLSEGRFAHDPYNPATVTVPAFAAVSPQPQPLLSTSSQAKYAVPAMCAVHTPRAPPAPAEHIFSTHGFHFFNAFSWYERNPYSLVHVTRPVNAPTRTSLHDHLVHSLPPTVHDSCSNFNAEDRSSIYSLRDLNGPDENFAVLDTCSETSSSIYSDTRATAQPDTHSSRTSSLTTTRDAPPAPAEHIFPTHECHSRDAPPASWYVRNPYSLVHVTRPVNAPTRTPFQPPPSTVQARDVPVAVRSIYDANILNAHGLRRCPISQFVPERSLEHAGGDLRTYAQKIDVRNIPTGRHKLAGQVCEDLLSYIIGWLFWDEAKPDRRFAFLRTNLIIQVSAPHPTSRVAEVVFSWSHSQGPAESSFANITLWLSKTLRTGIKNFGRSYRVLFDVDGVIWWGENPTNAAAHWRDLDRYLKENAELRQDETTQERSKRFGWMPLSYLILKCHYVEPKKCG